jgi:hypothetical protein
LRSPPLIERVTKPLTLRYDIAVRNYVEGGQTMLLTERECFSHLYMSIVVPDRVEFVATTTTLCLVSGRPMSNPEICNKYNSLSECPTTLVDINMPAKTAERKAIEATIATRHKENEKGLQPKYLHYNLWGC